jgi:hypothetical protein
MCISVKSVEKRLEFRCAKYQYQCQFSCGEIQVRYDARGNPIIRTEYTGKWCISWKGAQSVLGSRVIKSVFPPLVGHAGKGGLSQTGSLESRRNYSVPSRGRVVVRCPGLLDAAILSVLFAAFIHVFLVKHAARAKSFSLETSSRRECRKKAMAHLISEYCAESATRRH